MDLSKRTNLLNVREVRGLVLADPLSPTGMLGADWSPMVELRADSSDPDFWNYTGEASVVEHPYIVRDMFGEFTETIADGAFKETLSRAPDVMFNYMHDPATTMATTRGGGLELAAKPNLYTSAKVSKRDVDAQRVMPKVERGDATSMSFAFRVTRQEWDEDYLNRRILEVNLHRGDVSVIVTGLGANPAASGTVRYDLPAFDWNQIAAVSTTTGNFANGSIQLLPAEEDEIEERDDEALMWDDAMRLKLLARRGE